MKKLLLINSGLILILLLNCTNPFSTRDPEEPDLSGGSSTINDLQTNPDSLLTKLRQSFSLKNVTNYEECLADPNTSNAVFVFIPEPREITRFNNWNRQDECFYFNKLINTEQLNDIIINFDISNRFQVSADTVEMTLSYLIELKFRTETENYQGQCIFKMLRSSAALWYIYYWEDVRLDATDPSKSWSTLKADYRY
ncbi:MAG: hypothetical protein ACE5GL_09150 [Calditrichia bacterium]